MWVCLIKIFIHISTLHTRKFLFYQGLSKLSLLSEFTKIIHDNLCDLINFNLCFDFLICLVPDQNCKQAFQILLLFLTAFWPLTCNLFNFIPIKYLSCQSILWLDTQIKYLQILPSSFLYRLFLSIFRSCNFHIKLYALRILLALSLPPIQGTLWSIYSNFYLEMRK